MRRSARIWVLRETNLVELVQVMDAGGPAIVGRVGGAVERGRHGDGSSMTPWVRPGLVSPRDGIWEKEMEKKKREGRNYWGEGCKICNTGRGHTTGIDRVISKRKPRKKDRRTRERISHINIIRDCLVMLTLLDTPRTTRAIPHLLAARTWEGDGGCFLDGVPGGAIR